MSQRNPLNDRYNKDKTGKTRKSSASAKPKATRAATLRDPAPKTKKQKKQEAREREREAQKKAQILNARYEDTSGYKTLRRRWWACIIVAIAVTAISVFCNAKGAEFFEANPDGLFLGIINESSLSTLSAVCMVAAYVFIIYAFWLDLGKIRKERKIFNAAVANDNSKEGREAQKRARAEQRALEQEEARKNETAQAEASEKKAATNGRGPLGWLRRGKNEASEAKEQLQEKAAEAKKDADAK